jgi:Flp pilus assembly protein TadG
MFRRASGFMRSDQGAVAPLVAIALIALVGMGALAWDVSRAFALRGELDSAVDAAALAGATQLDGGTDAITRATAAAKGALVTNSQRLGNSHEAAVAVADADIKFLTSLSPTRTYTTAAGSANFIEINLTPRSLGLVTGALIHSGAFSVRAHAVAGYGSAYCIVPPLLICNPVECAGSTFNPDANIGKLMLLTPSGKNKATGTKDCSGDDKKDWAPGNFGFLDVGAGASDLADALGRNTPLTQCFGTTVQSEPGNVTSVDDYINTRFDIYKKNGTNTSFYSPAPVTIIGVNAATTSCNPSVTDPTSDCSVLTGGPFGFSLDCGQATGANMGNGSWNWKRYFAVNHPTATINPATFDWTPYGPNGVVSGQPTRFQVYNWEKALIAGTATGDSAFASSGLGKANPSTSGDWARPVCNTQTPSQLQTDRRTISALMTNCNGKNGKFTATVIAAVDLFLTAPIGPNQSLYGEIVGKTSADTSANLGVPEKRFWVRLYE